MAYQTYINGEIKPTIVYAGKSENDGYLPTAVYVDGELITPLSAVEKSASADGTVEAYTEYEKALKSVTVTGTTYQSTDVSPIFPQPIENANDNGMSVVLHGYNLFNKELCISEGLRNETEITGYGAPQMRPEIINTILKPSTKYTMSFEVEGVIGMPENATFKNGQGFIFVPSTSSPYLQLRSNKIAQSGEVYSYQKTFTTPATFYEDNYILYAYTGQYTIDGVSLWTYPTCIIRNVQIVEGTEEKPYEPYFRKKISIPQSIEVDGSTVDLRLAHIPKILNDYRATTATDYLKVDRVANKVEYVQGTDRLVFDGTGNFAYRSPNIFKSDIVLNAIRMGNSAYCNKYKLYLGVGSLTNQDYGFTTDGQYYGTKSVISIKDIRFDNVADFKADLEQNPVEVLYCLETPITHDITNTDLGQSLLALNLKRKDINVLEVDSNQNAPQVPTKLIYNIWGGRNENNNNT